MINSYPRVHLTMCVGVAGVGGGQRFQRSGVIYFLNFVAWPQGYKTIFMLNTVEHEILNAHEYKKISRHSFF